MNLIIVDDKQLMAGSFSRYLKNRFGHSVEVNSVTDSNSCLEKIDGQSKVIILDYVFDSGYDTEHGAGIFKTIKAQRPDAEVILLSSPDDVRKDMVKAIKQMERRASSYIIRNKGNTLNVAVSSIENAVMQPIRVLSEEHSIAEFFGLFLFAFLIVGIIVLAAEFIIRA